MLATMALSEKIPGTGCFDPYCALSLHGVPRRDWIGASRSEPRSLNKRLFALIVFLTSITALQQSLLAQASTSGQTSSNSQVIAANGSTESSGTSQPATGPNSAQANEEAKKYYKLGTQYGRARLFKQAATTFMIAIRLRPNYADAHRGLGYAYFNMARWKEAIDSLEQSIKLDPSNAAAYAKLGEAYTRWRAETKTPGEEAGVGAGDVVKPKASPAPPSKDKVAKPELTGEKVQTKVTPVPASGGSPTTSKIIEAELALVYRVGVGDVLDVRLRDAPANQSSLFTVSASGLLEHPILPQPLKVQGLTTEEISQRMASDLKSRAIHDAPEVLVGVREYVSHTVLVSGLVKEPGQKVLRREAIPLYVVIANAQPLPDAGRAVIISQRASEAITVDLSDPKLMDLLVHSGDVINVQPSPKQYLYIGGEIKAPGEKPFRSGMTLTQAILAAGGLTRDAGQEVRIARDSANGRLLVTRYKLRDINSGKLPDPLIEPGDRITVAQ